VESLRQFLHGLLVKRCLRAAELAERLDLGLVGQIGNDRLVGLQTPQNIRPHQLTQRAVWIVGPVRKALNKIREFLGRAEQPWVEEVEDGPQIAEPVLDWRA